MLSQRFPRRRRWSAVMFLAALLGVVGVLAASAGADSSPGPAVVTFTATKAAATSPSGAASPATGSQITCNVSIDDPHNSTHVPETVNVVSHVTCDQVVSSISITTKLFRAGIQVASNNSYAAEAFTLNGNAAVNCVNGSYGGTADATVVFPPGYSPSSESAHVESDVVSITC